MNRLSLSLLLFFCWMLLPYSAEALSDANGVREGNRLYNQKRYDEAIERYNTAREESPDSDIIHFNIGAAMYKKGEYQEAIDAFTRSLLTEDQALEAKANYNIANSKYRLGSQKAESDLSGAVGLYREALDYYKRAIELNENDQDAKYNHELVEKNLRILLDRLKRKQEQNSQGQDKDNQKDTKQSQAESDKEKGKEKQGQDTRKKQIGDEDKEDKTTPEEDTGEAQYTESAGEEGEMTPEEARMLLETYGQDEAMEIKQHQTGYVREVLKDW